MIYYNEIKLKDVPFDLTGMRPNDRIVYFPGRNSIVFCKSQFAANNKYDGEVYTKMTAVGKYPDKFFVMKKKAKKDTNFSIVLPPDMYNFCQRRGIIGDYIRSLIRREMDKENNP